MSDTQLAGSGWWHERRTRWDVLRCVLGLHRPAVTGLAGGMLVQRCTCGAFGPAPWVYLSSGEAREKWRTRERRTP